MSSNPPNPSTPINPALDFVLAIEGVPDSGRRTGTDDLSLPKATVAKILTEILPPDSGMTTTKDYRDALIEACVEFVTLISSQANDISEKDNKKTISAEHIAMALKELEFDSYIGPVLECAEEYRKVVAVSGILILLMGLGVGLWNGDYCELD